MLMPPWVMAHSSTVTFPPMTMVPVRSLRTTLAILSGRMGSSSMLATKSTTFLLKRAGMLMSTRPGFVALAMLPYWEFTAAATREAVVKSALDRERLMLPLVPKSSSTVRSTMAALGESPTVGKFFCTRFPPLPAMNPPVETAPWATA